MLKQLHVDVWIDKELHKEYRVFIKNNNQVIQYQNTDIERIIQDIVSTLRTFEK